MTDHTPSDSVPERAILDEIQSLQAENARAIAELASAQRQNTQAIERLHEAIDRLRTEHERTSNDVSTLKGWVLENLCERRPELFANAFGLSSAEVISKDQIVAIATAAHDRGIIN